MTLLRTISGTWARLCPAADIRVANCERVYADPSVKQVSGRVPAASPASTYVFSDCGFDVVSLAGNHTMDFGEAGLVQTMDALHQRGIATVGAGRTLAEARKPAFVERKGTTVAFLGYCSVMMKGHAAGRASAGIAPMRAHTFYEQTWDWEPGSPAVVRSLPDDEDLQQMRRDIAQARQQANIVVLMLHWGVHLIPYMMAEYQPIVARAAFAAGADLILGHHAGVPKAVAIHDGKACFYSLAYFLMSVPERTPEQQALRQLDRFGIELDPDYPRLPFGRDSQRSMIARAELSRSGIDRISFVPVWLDKQLRPELLSAGDPRSDEAVRYIDLASEGFDHRFVRDGDEIVVMSEQA